MREVNNTFPGSFIGHLWEHMSVPQAVLGPKDAAVDWWDPIPAISCEQSGGNYGCPKG